LKLIDTDILIDHFHGHQAALDFITQQLVAGETLAISVVTVTEFAGGMRPGEEARTERLLTLFTILIADVPGAGSICGKAWSVAVKMADRFGLVLHFGWLQPGASHPLIQSSTQKSLPLPRG
jgi:predicted nucleic acid-binding protein